MSHKATEMSSPVVNGADPAPDSQPRVRRLPYSLSRARSERLSELSDGALSKMEAEFGMGTVSGSVYNDDLTNKHSTHNDEDDDLLEEIDNRRRSAKSESSGRFKNRPSKHRKSMPMRSGSEVLLSMNRRKKSSRRSRYTTLDNSPHEHLRVLTANLQDPDLLRINERPGGSPLVNSRSGSLNSPRVSFGRSPRKAKTMVSRRSSVFNLDAMQANHRSSVDERAEKAKEALAREDPAFVRVVFCGCSVSCMCFTFFNMF